jgi:hypothetical protein
MLLYINCVIIICIYIFLIYSVFTDDLFIVRVALYLSVFMLLKWIFNYRKCTVGYWECKLRNVKRENGIINKFCEYYGDLIYSEYNIYLFILLMSIYTINIIKFIKLTRIYI